MYGYAGKILKVDLTENKITEESLDISIAKKFLGGLGLASYYLYRDFKPGTDAFSPDNVVVISPGLFVGSGLGTASKTAFVSKSPATNGFGRAIAGATIGPQIRKAGYDAIVIKGSCRKPSILVIDDNKVSVEETDLWGLDTRESQKKMKQKYGNSFATAA
ncbi:MAG: aldehyde ferredoxin oxidoreductase N-terminal domain-containing protein, partial [Thermoplasmata archaeon]